MNPANQSLPPGYSASDIVPVGGDQSQPSSPSSQPSSLPPGYTADDIVPTDNAPTQEAPQPQQFTTSSGQTFQVGQSVQHSDGTHGEVQGQHPGTGNAVVKWHTPPAKNWKQGEMVRVNGEPSTVVGYTNNGKLLVEGKWGKFGGTHAVSPADIDDNPGEITSAASGFANSLLKSGTGVAHIFGAHPQGLENAQQNAQAAQEANPASGKAGELAGDLVQFLSVNGMVKAGTGAVALKTSEQYAQAARILKTLEEHPVLRKILHAGINGALTGGIMGGVQSGGDPTATAEGAAGGALTEGAGEFAPEIMAGAKKVGSAIAHPIDTAGSALGAVARGTGKAVSKVAGGLNDAAETYLPDLYPKEIEVPSNVEQAQQKIQARINTQPAYDQHAADIRKAFTDGLKSHGIDFQIPEGTDVRKIPDMAKKALENEYKPLYGKVDEALEKEGFEDKYQDLEDNVKTATDAAKAARKLADTKPEGVVGANSALSEAKAQLAEADAILKEQGLDGAVKRASSLYKAAKAADEFKGKILSHTQDLNGTLPRVNPDGFNKALNNLKYKQRYQGNRLDQLFGEKAGSQLMADTRAAQSRVGALKNQEQLRVAGVQDLKNEANVVQAKRAKVQKFAAGLAKSAVGGGIAGEALGLFK